MLIPILLKKPDALKCRACGDLILPDQNDSEIAFLDVDLEAKSKLTDGNGAVVNIFCGKCKDEL